MHKDRLKELGKEQKILMKSLQVPDRRARDSLSHNVFEGAQQQVRSNR